MADNVLNFKNAIVAQLTDYLMVARLSGGEPTGGGYYSVSDLMDLINTIQVEDILTSENINTALSANQGRILSEAINSLIASLESDESEISSHIENISNPHGVNVAQLGLENVENIADKDKVISDAQALVNALKADKSTVEALSTRVTKNEEDISTNASDIEANELDITTLKGRTSSLENRADTLEEEMDTKADSSLVGANNGIATLDNDGKVPSTQLPSYVDDVLEYVTSANFPPTGESAKIYIALDTGKTYRWGGTQYVEISASLALGEDIGSAYEGSKGKFNRNTITSHIANNSNPHSVTKAQLGLGDVDPTSDMDKPVSTAQQTALDGKVDSSLLEANNTIENANLGASAYEAQTRIEEDITENTSAITDLQSKLLGTEYGIMINETTGEVTRTGSAVGMNFGTPDGVNPIDTDFDNVSIWRNMHAVKVSLDGVVKEPTEDGYDTFDGSCMVSIPQGYFIKDERIDGFRYVSICDKQLVGYYPIKVKYLNAMLASDDGNGNLVCKPNLPPRRNISYNTTNTILKAQGDGKWVNYDITANYIKWALSSIEAGSINHKASYGRGIQSGMPYGSTGYDIKVASTGNTVVVDSSKFYAIGMLVQIGTSYTNDSITNDRFITDITDNGDGTQTLTVDGDSFSVEVGNTCVTWGQPIPQTQYDVMKNGSGYILQFGSEYRSHVFYRGMPLHGNQWVITDGFRRYDGEYYGCTDPEYYGASDIRISEGWTDLGFNILADNGYQKIRECVKLGDGFVDVPIEWGSTASSETFYSAYLYNFNSSYMGDRVLRLGGYWDYGSYVSPVFSVGGYAPSYAYFSIGCAFIRY